MDALPTRTVGLAGLSAVPTLRATLNARPAHFTDPASTPCTK